MSISRRSFARRGDLGGFAIDRNLEAPATRLLPVIQLQVRGVAAEPAVLSRDEHRARTPTVRREVHAGQAVVIFVGGRRLDVRAGPTEGSLEADAWDAVVLLRF